MANDDLQESQNSQSSLLDEARPSHLSVISPEDLDLPQQTTDAKSTPKTGKLATVFRAIFGTIGLLILGAYLAGVVFFHLHFLPNTTLHGTDISLKTTASVAEEFSNTAVEYQTNITGDGLDVVIPGYEIDLALDTQSYAFDAISQQYPWLWPLSFQNYHPLEARQRADYDREKLDNILKEAIEEHNKNSEKTKNATISYSNEKKVFEIAHEVYGTEIDEALCVATVGNAISELETSIRLGNESLVQPDLTYDDVRLTSALVDANKFIGVEIKLVSNGEEIVTIGPDVIKNWVSLDESVKAKFDEDKLSSWVNDQLAPSLNTVGSARTYTRPDGATFTVEGGSYGWQVDVESVSGSIVDAIKSHKSAEVEIPATQTAAVWATDGSQDWGSTYIDVDLSAQYARFYQGSDVIWESALVSGETSTGHSTPTGVWYLNSNKRTDTTLIGFDEDHDGEPDYKTPVKYWMPFVGDVVAFHDANWRYSFGGTIYVYNGSHGCVNLPYDAAQRLYDIAPVGTVVVVHW